MKSIASLGVLVWLFTGPAFAHANGAPVQPSDVWQRWNFDPWICAMLMLSHWAYGRGVLRAWARAGRDRIIARWRIACFLAGEVFLLAALVSPIDPLGETLLSAHMGQHILLTTLAPPLLILGAPWTAWLWAMPKTWRCVLRVAPLRLGGRILRKASQPLNAALIHAVALWVWHAPAAFEAALRDAALHTLEHASFLGTALLFWQASFARTTHPLVGALCVSFTFVQSGILGALLSLAPQPIYSFYGDLAVLWNTSALEDQQISGLMMWAPAGLIYLLAFALLLLRAFPRERIGIMRASTSS